MLIVNCYTGFFNVRRGWQSLNTRPRFYLRLIRRTGWLWIYTSRTTDGRPFKPKKLSVPFIYPGVPAWLTPFRGLVSRAEKPGAYSTPGTPSGWRIAGVDPGVRRAEGGAKIFGVFRVKNHDFAQKNHIFSNCGGRRENFWSISCEKSRFYAKKSYFFQFKGGGGPPPWIRPWVVQIKETLKR
jgi:hypothetical protein